METPKQQAAQATANTIAMHREALQFAKQATWDIIAKQKAAAQAASQRAREDIQQQLAAAQQVEETVESSEPQSSETTHSASTESQSSETAHSASTESQESSSPRQAEGMKQTVLGEILMPPSLQDTIAQLHSRAALVHQQMQTDLRQTVQQQFKPQSDTEESGSSQPFPFCPQPPA